MKIKIKMPFTPCMFESTRPVSAKKRDREKDAAKAETRLDTTRLCLSVCLSHSFSLSLSLSPKTQEPWSFELHAGRGGEDLALQSGGGESGEGGEGEGEGREEEGGGVVYLPCCWTDRRGGGRLSHSLAGLLLACCLSSFCPSHPQRAATCECGEPNKRAAVRCTDKSEINETPAYRNIGEKRDRDRDRETERKKNHPLFLSCSPPLILSYLICRYNKP